MFRIGNNEYIVSHAVLQAAYLPDEDAPEVRWCLLIECEPKEVDGVPIRPSLSVEDVLFSVDDPWEFEFAAVKLTDAALSDGQSSLFSHRKLYLWDLSLTFGELKFDEEEGHSFDLLVTAHCEPEDYPSEAESSRLRILTKIRFDGMHVPAQTIDEARSAIDQFSDASKFEIEQNDDGYLFKFPEP